jgi:hypothetical protein
MQHFVHGRVAGRRHGGVHQRAVLDTAQLLGFETVYADLFYKALYKFYIVC